MTDVYVSTLGLIIVAIITGIPVTLAAYWGYKAKVNSDEARVNSAVAVVNSAAAEQNSAEARQNSADAIHELKANGGMLEPNPTLNDKVNYVIEIAESDHRRLDSVVELLDAHLKHSKLMDQALAEVFFVVKPDINPQDLRS